MLTVKQTCQRIIITPVAFFLQFFPMFCFIMQYIITTDKTVVFIPDSPISCSKKILFTIDFCLALPTAFLDFFRFAITLPRPVIVLDHTSIFIYMKYLSGIHIGIDASSFDIHADNTICEILYHHNKCFLHQPLRHILKCNIIDAGSGNSVK